MLFLDAFWFFLPAGIANMTPIFAKKLPLLKSWNSPLDFGRKFKGFRIFGANKTWRGLILGGLLAGLLGWLIYPIVNPTIAKNTYVLGTTIMGCGALLGDAIESFFKRQLDIAPGKSWFPFDQLDYILGGLTLSYFVLKPTLKIMAIVTILYFCLHLLSSYIGFLLRLKDKPI